MIIYALAWVWQLKSRFQLQEPEEDKQKSGFGLVIAYLRK